MIVSFPSSGTAVPRQVTFTVLDEENEPSPPATVIINFVSIDNPPVLDLNGPQQSGRDYITTFTEGGEPVMVCVVIL